MKKNYILLLFTLVLSQFSIGQTVAIGTPGTTTNQAIPIEPYYGYTYSQCIYTAAELTAAGIVGVQSIDTLIFECTSTSLPTSNNWTVYLANSSKSSFSSSTDWEPISSFTQVFSSTISVTTVTGGNNIVKVALSTPFYWDGSSNLIIGTDENLGGYDNSSDDFYCRSTTGARSITYRADGTNPDPNSPPSATGTRNYVPNLSIAYSPAPTCLPPGSLNATGITATDATLGWTELALSTTWEYEYGPAGFTLGTGTRDTTTSNPKTITGLSALTSYEFYVRAKCGPTATDSSAWSGPSSFLTACASQLSGIYTLDPTMAVSATNFITMGDFMSFLSNCGVSGPTTLNVAAGSGPHMMGQDLGAYAGMSGSNPVVINGNGTTINKGTGNYFLALNGVKHFTINNFQFINQTPTVNMYGILMRGGCDSINITNNTINVGLNLTSSASGCIAATNSTTSVFSYADNANNCTITGNTLIGGYCGIIMNGQGTTTAKSSGHTITGNDIQDFYNYGIRLYYADSNLVANNELHRPNKASTSTFYGVYGYYSTNTKIVANKIHEGGAGTYTAYGIYLSNSSNTVGKETEMVNNAVYDLDAAFTFFGIYCAGTRDYVNLRHNTIETNTDGSTSTKYGMYFSGAPNNHDVTNNLIQIKGTGTSTAYGIYVATTSTSFSCDYNAVHVVSGGTNYYGRYSSNYATQAAWNTGSTFGANSLDLNPAIVAGTYTPLAVGVDNGGTPIATIPLDIDGTTRNATTPDFGAVEFTGIPGDMSITNAWLNEVSLCYGMADTAYATIKNEFGTLVDFSVNPLTVNWAVTGPLASTGTTTINTGTLAVGASMDVFVTTVDMSAAGTYTLSADISSNAVNASTINDTLTDHSTFDKKAMIEVDPKYDTIYASSDSVKISTKSPFFPGGAFFITEICQFRTSTGSPTGGWPSYFVGDDYVEIMGVPGSDLAGTTLEVWTGTTAPETSYTFPSGTVMSATGTAMVAGGAGTDDPTNNFYRTVGSSNLGWSSRNMGYILKDGSGTIIDAVVYGSYAFPAASGVTASDWTGTQPSTGGTCGIRLEGADVNSNTNWVASSTSPQNPNTINTGVTAPAPASVTGLQWTDLTTSTAIDTTPEIWVKGLTANGTYPYEVSYVTPCGTFTDTSYVTLLIQTLDTVAAVTVCDTFVSPLGGNVYTMSGYPTDTIFGTNPVYDSVIVYYPLTVNVKTTATETVAICDSLVSPSGKVFKTSGTYMDTIPNAVGCDSIITINLTITTTTFINTTVTACDSNVWRGQTLTTTGIYNDTVATGSCDSIFILDLTVNYASAASFTEFHCDSFVSPSGKVWNMDGTYIDTIVNATGCDSIMTFNLTFGYISYAAPVTTTVCDSLVSPSGKVWTTSGTYNDTVMNASGCDSVFVFNLTVNYSKSVTTTITACDSYVRPSGIVANVSGNYRDTISTTLGCDSAILTILTINYSSTSSISPVACASYTSPSGKVWVTSGTRNDTIVNATGCDSVITINLTIKASTSETRTISACFSYTVPETGNVYTTSGTYTDVTTNAFGCPHTITTVLTINTANAGTISVSGATLTASATGVTYKWVDCDNDYSYILGETNQSFTPVRNGNYACWITTPAGCSDTTACASINSVSLEEYTVTANDISIYPNPATTIVTIDILNQNSDEDISIQLFDAVGKLIYSREVSSTNNKVTFDVSDLTSGMYIVTVSNEFFKTSKKVTVN